MDWDVFVTDKRVVTQAQAEEALGRPATTQDRDEIVASIRRMYRHAGIVLTTDLRGRWLVTWGDSAGRGPNA